MKKFFTLHAFIFFAFLQISQAQTAQALYGWGLNNWGQLGDDVLRKYEPYQSGIDTDWAMVDAGASHMLAIKKNGTLWAWGNNRSGELGNGTTVREKVPVQIGTDTDWANTKAGSNHSVAIKKDGTLWAWGANQYGQLGGGSTISKNVPVQVGASSDWAIVYVGNNFTVAIKTDGTLWAWGYNGDGQLGNGTTDHSNVPVQVGTDTDWASGTVGYLHVLAVKKNGTLWAWGWNLLGQLGDGTKNDSNVPVQVGIDTDWYAVSAGDSHTIGNKTDGTLWTWGWNGYGQLGIGSTDPSLVPVQVGSATDWSYVAAKLSHNLAIKADGTLWAWGYNEAGQLGDGTTQIKNAPVQIGTSSDWTMISAGFYFAIGIKEDGSLWSWGDNSSGQLGDGNITSKYVPEIMGMDSDWSYVAARQDHTLAIKANGTLWAWGYNRSGQLGDGTTQRKYAPVQIGASSDWATVAAGDNHTLAVKTDGTLWTWGWNGYGQLGIGSTDPSLVPVQVGSATDWTMVASCNFHSLALKTDGTLWAWGYNKVGQLGDGTNTGSNLPMQIGSETNWHSISAGNGSSFGVKKDGSLWAWGWNGYGQLGDGSNTSKNVPVQIGSATDWAKVEAGPEFTFAVKTGGTLWGWGLNHFGQLGDGTTINKNAPVQIGTSSWATVAAGDSHTIGSKTDGTLWAWGWNKYGQLGNGTTTDKFTPVQIGTATNWKYVSAGRQHSVALFAAGIHFPILSSPQVDTHSSQNIAVEFSLPEAAQAGSVQLTFTSTGGTADANAPHTLTLDASFETAGEHSLTVDGSDFSASAGVAAVSSDPNDALVDGAVYTVAVSYQDQAGNPIETTENTGFTYDITAPSMETGQEWTLEENAAVGTVVGSIGASDNCGILSWSITSGNTSDAFAIDVAGSVTVNNAAALDYEVVQEFVLTVKATDAAGNDASESISIKLNGVNDNAPALTVPANLAGDEMSEISFTATATDEDIPAAELAFSLENAPEGTFINISTGDFSWTTTEEQGPAIYTFSVIVSDGVLSDTKEVTITVDEVNQAPVLTVPSGVQGDELSEISFAATATDGDIPAEILEYSLENDPAGASINPSTGEFSWIPTEEQGPETYRFNVRVSDGILSDTKEVTLIVNEVNEAPVIISEAITSAKAGEAYAYQLIATDADLSANALVYKALEMPSWLSFDIAKQLLSGTPGNDAAESSLVRLQVSDGQEVVTQEFTLTVEILTGIFDRNSQQASQITLYPNPTHGAITLSLGDEIAGEIIGLSLLDLSGRELLQQQGSLEQSMKKVNDYLQKAKAGVYLLELQRKENVLRVKVVKE